MFQTNTDEENASEVEVNILLWILKIEYYRISIRSV